MTTYAELIAQELNIRPQQVVATIALFDDGNTLPFIARYRKEATGNLDEMQIRQLYERLEKLRALDERRASILSSIREQGKLTPDLERAIEAVTTMTALEDLYLPFKPKRKTRASIARDKGLQGLADLILSQAPNQTPEQLAKQFLSADVPTIEEALQGARDIIAEMISDSPAVRGETREKALKFGAVACHKTPDAEDPKGTFANYYEFDYRLDRIKPHQILALNRGETEKVLKIKVSLEERDYIGAIEKSFRANRRSPLASQLDSAATDAAQRLLLPAIERDIRRILTETAEQHAIRVFAENLRGLLTQPPLGDKTVMGIDPAYRTGCKVAVVDATGKVLATVAIYPHEPQNDREKSKKTLHTLIAKHNVSVIGIGNGTASRETEQLVAELTRELPDVNYLMVNEAGASVYSASELAGAELPELDVTLRGAVSIARRVQDPLAELVKIDPQSIGVGLYQHDVDQKELAHALDGVVESVVNLVGVELNTASAPLLARVAGIGPKLAEKIVAHRNTNGAFKNRSALKKVAGLGAKTFEQAAGFLRVRESDHPLDASAIHPESYKVAEAVLKMAGLTMKSPIDKRETALQQLRQQHSLSTLAEQLGTGVHTLTDIFEQLIRPGRDPREDVPAPLLRSDVLKVEDLLVGMRLSGTVRNVVDFGSFIDIGVKQDGLLHVSQVPRGTRLSVGQILEVEIMSIDLERGRIGLGWAK